MSYQLHCPNCSTVIPPDSINVQKTIAACPQCGAVFNFGDQVPALNKSKRRKSKKPDHITQSETVDRLRLEMPLIQSGAFKLIMIAIPLFMSIIFMAIMGDVFSSNDADNITDAVIVGSVFLPIILTMFSTLFMKQAIEVNTEELKHEIRLGVPIYKRAMDVNDIVDVHAEEMTATRESVAQARYNLYAETYDGRQNMFMQNLLEETASYAGQVLSNYLQADEDENRLAIQDEAEADYSGMLDEEQSMNSEQQS